MANTQDELPSHVSGNKSIQDHQLHSVPMGPVQDGALYIVQDLQQSRCRETELVQKAGKSLTSGRVVTSAVRL